jgi:hypothetical protein
MKMDYGFVAFTGVKWADNEVDHYNSLSERIEAFENLGRQAPDHLLNGRHNFFCSCSEKYSKPHLVP